MNQQKENCEDPGGKKVKEDKDCIIVSNWDEEVIDNFKSMDLKNKLLCGIYSYGIQKPSAVQQRAIIPCIRGRNVIIQAQSGKCKIVTSSIAILQAIVTEVRSCQALILVPTRELAIEIQNVIAALSSFMNVKTYVCIGGTNIREVMKNLEQGVHVVIGTVGRVKDMIKRKSLCTTDIKLFVLDEADKMLSQFFKAHTQEIFNTLPNKVQVIMSSKISPEVLEESKYYMRDPVEILEKKENLTMDGIRHFYFNLHYDDLKYDGLQVLLILCKLNRTVVFCNTRNNVEKYTKYMSTMTFKVSAMHGEMDRNERDMIMNQFRSGSLNVVITTELLAGIIDVQEVPLVINCDLPRKENYINRMSRGGRFGKKGVTINLITDDERDALQILEQHYHITIEELPIYDIKNII